MLIRARNTLTDNAEYTFSTFQEVAGTNIIRWKNPLAFGVSWAMQVGATGDAQSEVVVLSSNTPAGSAGTIAGTTLYEHPSNTPLYAIKYDQIVFERSTTGTAGTAVPMTNGTLIIAADSKYTVFDDTSGSSTYSYRTFFRNSILSVNSTESDWITSAGFTFYSLGNIRQRVKDALWNASFLTDDIIDDWVNEWKDEMTNGATQVNQDYSMGTVDLAIAGVSNSNAGNEALGTITSVDFRQIRRIWFSTDGVSWYKSTKMDSNDFTPTQTFNATHPYHYFQGDTVLGIKPSDASGTARLEYYKVNPQLVNDTDEVPGPMKAYTKSFVDYCLSKASFKDDKLEHAQSKMQEAAAAKQQFVTEMAPRDKSGPTYINIVESNSGEDGWWF